MSYSLESYKNAPENINVTGKEEELLRLAERAFYRLVGEGKTPEDFEQLSEAKKFWQQLKTLVHPETLRFIMNRKTIGDVIEKRVATKSELLQEAHGEAEELNLEYDNKREAVKEAEEAVMAAYRKYNDVAAEFEDFKDKLNQ